MWEVWSNKVGEGISNSGLLYKKKVWYLLFIYIKLCLCYKMC